MSSNDWIVVALGIGAIALVNWYFFLAGRTVAVAAPAAPGVAASTPEITIIVDGGYSPNTIRVHSGTRTRLVFDRRDSSSCSDEVVFPDFGIRRYLPTGQRTTIDVMPAVPGTYEFMCGMSMLRGTLIAD